MPVGSLLFMPAHYEKTDIWRLTSKDTMTQVKTKAFTTSNLPREVWGGKEVPKKENGLVSQQGEV